MTTIVVPDSADMELLGAAIGRHLRAGDVLCLVGPLGAGKTTFTRGLARGLGVAGPVTSPTFVVARRHRGTHVDLVHCDAYRLGDHDDFLDVVPDPEDVVTVVEWGTAPIMSVIADSWLEIIIDRAPGTGSDQESRTVVFRRHGADWDDRDVSRWAGEP